MWACEAPGVAAREGARQSPPAPRCRAARGGSAWRRSGCWWRPAAGRRRTAGRCRVQAVQAGVARREGRGACGGWRKRVRARARRLSLCRRRPPCHTPPAPKCDSHASAVTLVVGRGRAQVDLQRTLGKVNLARWGQQRQQRVVRAAAAAGGASSSRQHRRDAAGRGPATVGTRAVGCPGLGAGGGGGWISPAPARPPYTWSLRCLALGARRSGPGSSGGSRRASRSSRRPW